MVWAYSNGVTTNQLLASLTFIGGGVLHKRFTVNHRKVVAVC